MRKCIRDKNKTKISNHRASVRPILLICLIFPECVADFNFSLHPYTFNAICRQANVNRQVFWFLWNHHGIWIGWYFDFYKINIEYLYPNTWRYFPIFINTNKLISYTLYHARPLQVIVSDHVSGQQTQWLLSPQLSWNWSLFKGTYINKNLYILSYISISSINS